MSGGGGRIAVGYSGGGDSLALLAIVRDWAVARGGTVRVFHVDHGLHAGSARLAAQACEHAAALGFDVEVLRWTPGPVVGGVQGRARAARHRLLAHACASTGVRGLLLAHTRDDQIETVSMRLARAPASPRALAGLAAVGPSPAWPEGAALALLRPLLGTPRAELRARLAAAGHAWIEDPANEDPAHERVRVRQALARLDAAAQERLFAVALEAGEAHAEALRAARRALSAVREAGLGGFTLERARFAAAPRAGRASALEALLTAAAGAPGPVPAAQIDALLEAIAPQAAFRGATLAGAAVAADGEGRVVIGRDPGGALGRADGAPARSQAPDGAGEVWDGRFAPDAPLAPAERLAPAEGWIASLSSADRRVLKRVHPLLRRAAPVVVSASGAPRVSRGAFMASQGLARRLLPDRPQAWSDASQARDWLGFSARRAHVGPSACVVSAAPDPADDSHSSGLTRQ